MQTLPDYKNVFLEHIYPKEKSECLNAQPNYFEDKWIIESVQWHSCYDVCYIKYTLNKML